MIAKSSPPREGEGLYMNRKPKPIIPNPKPQLLDSKDQGSRILEIYKGFASRTLFSQMLLTPVQVDTQKIVFNTKSQNTRVVPMKPGQCFVQARNSLYRNSIKTGVFSSSFHVDSACTHLGS